MLSSQNISNLFSYVILRFLKRFQRNVANYLNLRSTLNLRRHCNPGPRSKKIGISVVFTDFIVSQLCKPGCQLPYYLSQLMRKRYLSHRRTAKAQASLRIALTIWAATWQNQQNECAPSEDSDQPGHPPGLIRVFAVRMKKAWVLSYPLSAFSEDSDQIGRSHIVGFVMLRLISASNGSFLNTWAEA